ncbi:ABC transport permease subunit MlaE [Posidoniimonas polymericola]|uniref:ABC transport permease subunit MlaE n=1 Tax=Posidoniimonas polymericola TaxID=2528002 RepID=A0A5C5YSI9_9BACT|nr:ABC transporter permease [Posidoniimonas polymericola]TWT77761.1 ABC transport permease subunit MlaE [Posidoniimonas polymericola]
MSTAEREAAAPRPPGILQGVRESLIDLGDVVLSTIESVGDIVLFGARTVGWTFTRLPNAETLLISLYQIGVRSLPVVALTGTFIGMVLAVQAYYQFRTFGMETRLGAMINLSMYRELGPVLAATMLAGRIGSSIAAELGTMRVTEQIDALESLGANPLRYLVVPRLLACLLMIPALTIMAMLMGVAGGAYYCIYIYDVDSFFYFNNANEAAGAWDVWYGVIKSFFFGGAIAIISCYRGFNCDPGAEGVGRASTIAFVQSFVVILVMDLGLSIMLDKVYFLVWPEEAL